MAMFLLILMNIPLIGDSPHKRLSMQSVVNFLTQIIWWCSCDVIKMRCQVILNSPLLMGWWEYVVYIYIIYIISATLSTDYLSWTWLAHYCRVDVARYGEKENKLQQSLHSQKPMSAEGQRWCILTWMCQGPRIECIPQIMHSVHTSHCFVVVLQHRLYLYLSGSICQLCGDLTTEGLWSNRGENDKASLTNPLRQCNWVTHMRQ